MRVGKIEIDKYCSRFKGSKVQRFKEAYDKEIDVFSVVLLGCVQYRTVFDSVAHQIGFIYEVHRTDPANQNMIFAMVIGQEPWLCAKKCRLTA